MKYQEPKIRPIILAICKQFNLSEKDVVAFVKEQYPELTNKEACANCGASMAIYTFSLDTITALLLVGMGKIVADRINKHAPFTEANMVHLQTCLNKYYSVPSRSTQASKLGLIAKVLNEDGSHNNEAGWLITKRGFAFLRGDSVPRTVTSFRNEIVDRGEETTTLSEVHKEADVEYYNEFTYHKRDWVDIAGYTDGKQPII